MKIVEEKKNALMANVNLLNVFLTKIAGEEARSQSMCVKVANVKKQTMFRQVNSQVGKHNVLEFELVLIYDKHSSYFVQLQIKNVNA